MSEKQYTLGQLLRARVEFLKKIGEENVYMDGSRWIDYFLMWLGEEEDGEKK